MYGNLMTRVTSCSFHLYLWQTYMRGVVSRTTWLLAQVELVIRMFRSCYTNYINYITLLAI